MKRQKINFVLMAAAVAVAAAAGCSGNSGKECNQQCVVAEASQPGYPAYYAGQFPAADAEGVAYGVIVTPYGDTTAVYSMSVSYVGVPGSDSVDHGKVRISKGTPEDAEATVYTFVSANPDNPSMNFVATDTTLTMVGADLKPAPSGLNYTLSRQM